MATGDKLVTFDMAKAMNDDLKSATSDLPTMRGALNALLKQDDGGYPLIPGTAEGWMEQGTLNLEYGTEMASSKRIRLRSLIPVRDIARFEADEGYQIYVLCYDADRNFNGVWYHNELVINMGLWQPVVNVLKVPNDVAYVRPMMSKTDGENIVIAEARALKIWRRMNEAAFDAENPFMPRLMNTDEPYLEYGLAGFELLEPGAIDGTGADADGAQYVNNSRRTPGLWPLNGAESIVSHLEWITIISAYNYIFWYTENGTYISRAGGRNTNTVIGIPPSNAAYFRVSLTSTTAGDINDDNVTDYVIKWRVINPNVRKKWYVLGDSISAGYYSLTKTMADEMGLTFFYESPVTAPDGDATGSLYDPTLQHNYWGYANRWINKALVPLGTPGQGYLRTAFNSKSGINVVQENDFAGADLITVAWGFNDWHYNLQRGNHDLIDTAEPYATAATDASRITTINQAIWYCLGVLIDKAPDAEIVVQTPMNAWAYGGDFASNWSINYAMSNSGTLAQIHDDIVYWADYYGLKVLDLTYNNSFVNRQNIKSAIIDGSHPSDETHKRLGRYVANTLTGVTDVRRTDVEGSMAKFITNAMKALTSYTETKVESTGDGLSIDLDEPVAWASRNYSAGDIIAIGSELWRADDTIAKNAAINYNNARRVWLKSYVGGTGNATGALAHAEGYSTQAKGDYSHAEGYDTYAYSLRTHAEGWKTHAGDAADKLAGTDAHAEGSETTASGFASHAEGSQTTASGNYSHAEGKSTTASGYGSHAAGFGTNAAGNYQIVFGKNNVADASENAGVYVEIVGNGSSSSNRSNARTLDWSGNEALQGSLTLGKGTADETTITAAQLKALLAMLS